jgi:hypothetical protein
MRSTHTGKHQSLRSRRSVNQLEVQEDGESAKQKRGEHGRGRQEDVLEPSIHRQRTKKVTGHGQTENDDPLVTQALSFYLVLY